MVGGDETVSAIGTTPGGSGDGGELQPTILIDRYQIERRLGAGGMGVVYAARDIHLGRTVAVKLVGPRIDPGSGQGRLVREAQAMAKLRHPNIATVYDIGVSGDRLFVRAAGCARRRRCSVSTAENCTGSASASASISSPIAPGRGRR